MSEMFDEGALARICDWLIEDEFMQIQGGEESHPERAAVGQLLKSHTEDVAKGYTLIVKSIASSPNGADAVADYQIREELVEQLRHPERAVELWHEHISLQGILGFSEEEMAEMYTVGVNMTHDRCYIEASHVFLYLLYLNPFVPWFWHQLGRAWQGEQNFDHACYAYSVAINLETRTLDLYRDAVRCCLEAQEYERADGILEYGIQRIRVGEWDSDSHTLIDQLEAMRAYVRSLQEKRGHE